LYENYSEKYSIHGVNFKSYYHYFLREPELLEPDELPELPEPEEPELLLGAE
jgi:hypothetical protein